MFPSAGWSEKFTLPWAQENDVTLEMVMDISSRSNAEEKFKLSQLLYYSGWVFKDTSEAEINSARSVILHEAAAMGHADAQFILSIDYESGAKGFTKNLRLAELWFEKSIQNGFEINEHVTHLDEYRRKREYSCSLNLETVTGLDRTDVRKPNWSFRIQFEYGNFSMASSYNNEELHFTCSKPTFLGSIGPYLQRQCVAEVTDGLAQYFLMADKPTVNKTGPTKAIPYTWVSGLPDLVTIRQGNCHFQPTIDSK